MNFQVVSSMSGIEYLENQNCEYILKTRSDQRICKPHFLGFFLCLLKQFPAQNNNGMKRLVVTQGMVGGVMLKPFMITDFLYFGETAVVKAIFDKAYNDALIHVFSPYFYALLRMWSVVVSKSRARFTRS